MSSFINQQINPPENWQDFEKLCAALWSEIWSDPNTRMHGRRGQKQHGIDVYGRIDGSGDWQGVQCKGKDVRYGSQVTEAELKAEVKKAKKFNPRIKAFVLATTAPNDASIQEVARKLTEAHKKTNLFSVEVVSWDEIQRHLAKYPKILDVHFPDQGPAQHRIERQLEELNNKLVAQTERSQAPTETVSDVMRALRSAGVIPAFDKYTGDPADEALNREIDSYRDRIFSKPATALDLLQDLRKRCWDEASKAVRFRIVTNIAAAYMELAEFEKAADHFLEAGKFAANDDPKAIRNNAFAYLLQKDLSRALEETERALALDADNSDGFSVLIAASSQLDDTIVPEALVPEDKLTEPNILFAIGHVYQHRGDHSKALEWFKKAYDLKPTSTHYKATYGSELLGSVLSPLEAPMEGDMSEQEEKDIEQAVVLLGEMWGAVSNTELEKTYLWAGVNLANGVAALDRPGEANVIIARLIAHEPEDRDIRKLAAIVALKENKAEVALEHLSHIDPGRFAEIDLLRAQTLAAAGKYDDALEAIDAIPFEDLSELHNSVAIGLRIRLLVQTKGFEATRQIVEKAQKEHHGDLILMSSIVKMHMSLGSATEAENIALELLASLPEDASHVARFTVADLLYDLELLREAGSVYQSLRHGLRDTQTQRRLLVCLVNTDQRKAAVDILEALPNKVRKLKFYRRLATALYIRSGDSEKALEEAEKYLEQEPEDLEVQLYWIGIQQGQGNDDAIKKFLETAQDYPYAAPLERMQLSHLLAHYGFHERGLHLAYQLRREYQDNPKIHLGYVGLVLAGLPKGYPVNASKVEPNTAFKITNERGASDIFIIEDEWKEKKFPSEILSSHPYAQAALGHVCGDTFEVAINPMQTQKWHIDEVLDKHVYIFQSTMSEFAKNFPENKSLFSVDVTKSDEQGFDFAPIFKALDDRQNYVNEIENVYQKGAFTVGMIAKLLGVNPLEAWPAFLQDERFGVKCCDGSAEERVAALALVDSEDCSFVVDPLTLYSIVILDVHTELSNAFGPLCIAQSTIDMYRRFVKERRAQPAHGSMAKLGEQYTLQEHNAEHYEEVTQTYERILEWAENNCEILPAVGKRDISSDWDESREHIPSSFVDCIMAASGSDKVLLSDDQRLRQLAKGMLDVDGVWLQSAMMEAMKRGVLSKEKYSETVVWLSEANISFIAFENGTLCTLADMDGWKVSDRIKLLLNRLGGKNIELQSALSVAINFLIDVWKRPIAVHDKKHLTYAVLNGLISEKPELIQQHVALVIRNGHHIPASQRKYLINALQEWSKGHFIPFPPEI